MNIEEYFKLSYKHFPRPQIVCRDGFTVSIQGGKYYYSIPKKNGSNFEEYELGFPEPSDSWLLEALNVPDSKEDVFGYVPLRIVNTLLERHGGIDEDKMLSILTMMELTDETS